MIEVGKLAAQAIRGACPEHTSVVCHIFRGSCRQRGSGCRKIGKRNRGEKKEKRFGYKIGRFFTPMRKARINIDSDANDKSANVIDLLPDSAITHYLPPP